MTVTATAVETFALWVSPTGAFRLLHWNTSSTAGHALSCDTARPFDLTTQLIMWADDDAIELGKAPNSPAYELLRTYQASPAVHFGDVVFTGSTDAEGNTAGLTVDQALMLLGRFLQRISRVPRQRDRR